MTGYTLTKEKIAELKSELRSLKGRKLKEVAQRFLTAHDDNLGEGDDTIHDISIDKRSITDRIKEIETILKNCTPIVPNGKDHVVVGSKVTVETDGGVDKFQIVSSIEAEPFKHKVSDVSPIGKALLGKVVGDTVRVELESFSNEYTIVAIE